MGGSATFLTEFGTCKPNATLTNSTGKLYIVHFATVNLKFVQIKLEKLGL